MRCLNSFRYICNYCALEPKRSLRVQKRFNSFESISKDASPKTKVNYGHWSDVNVQREALERAGKQLGVKELDDWYSISRSDIKLSFISYYYKGSLRSALKNLYPHHQWDSNRFSRIYWNDKDAQRDALERYGREKLGVKELDDWHSVSPKEVTKALSFIHNHYGSLKRALKALYPNHRWKWKPIERAPIRYWKNLHVQREALEKYGRTHFGVKQLDDWYNVNSAEIRTMCSFIGEYYNGSLYNTLKTLYPHHKWDMLRFLKVPHRYWKEQSAKREGMDRCGRELGVKELDDWYRVSTADVHNHLSFVYRQYGSLYNALLNVYPEHEWDPLKFHSIPRGYWKLPITTQHFYNTFVEWKREYNITNVKEWYQLPPHQLKIFKRAANGIFGSVHKLMNEWFPEITWRFHHTAQIELQVDLLSISCLVE
jgi:hypothetical protein